MNRKQVLVVVLSPVPLPSLFSWPMEHQVLLEVSRRHPSSRLFVQPQHGP